MTTPPPPSLPLLHELAIAATPGPWHVLKRCDNAGPDRACGVTSDHRTEHGHIRGIFQSDAYDECSHPVSRADAAYIAAASPDVVLSLLARITELEAVLPRCLGEWKGGSGGHRKYIPGCKAVGVWDVGLGHVCDEHLNRNGGDDDALSWFATVDVLHARDKRITELESALREACEAFDECGPEGEGPYARIAELRKLAGEEQR